MPFVREVRLKTKNLKQIWLFFAQIHKLKTEITWGIFLAVTGVPVTCACAW